MLTEEQDRIMAKFIADYNGGLPTDYIGESDGTRDDFCRYDGTAWREASEPVRETREGFPAIYFEKVQALRGQPRRQLWVIDFGEIRGIYQL